MASSLTSTTLRRSSSLPSQSLHLPYAQVRHASLLKRPIRPYTFTQLIMLSDGSTYTSRTTSPAPLYKSTKDTRNSILWQPSLTSLRNIEEDEAGRLRAFRAKFGRGWDMEVTEEEEGSTEAAEKEDSLMDLISAGYDPSKNTNLGGISTAEAKRAAKAAAKKKK